jgi:hypothetical protein
VNSPNFDYSFNDLTKCSSSSLDISDQVPNFGDPQSSEGELELTYRVKAGVSRTAAVTLVCQSWRNPIDKGPLGSTNQF